MTFTQVDIDRLLSIIRHGRANAITAPVIAERLGYSIINNQVKTRNLIRYAISIGHVILSVSHQNPKGFWISTVKQEVIVYISSLNNRSTRLLERMENIRNSWGTNNPRDLI